MTVEARKIEHALWGLSNGAAAVGESKDLDDDVLRPRKCLSGANIL